jgi:hypothetical protein
LIIKRREFLPVIYRRWLLAGEVLLEMIILHFSSPVITRNFKVDTFYTGPFDDECETDIFCCEPDGL